MSIKDYIHFSDLPTKNKKTPSWANQFYDNPDQINVNKLKTDVNNWIIAEKKERKEEEKKENKSKKESELQESDSENPIVRFTINFLNKVPSSWINKAGFIDMPTSTAYIKEAVNLELNRTLNHNNTENKNVLVNNWLQIGSKEIIYNGVQAVSSTNVLFISVAPTSTNIRFASTETGVLYKTIDSGANWTFLLEESGPTAFHPTDVNKIILGSNPFRLSSDGGATWTVKPISANCNEILWSKDGTTILAATEQGVFVSGDSGLTFNLKQVGFFMDVEFKPGSSTIAYAITDTGMFYKTTDAGLTWVLKPTSYSANLNKNGFLLAATDADPNIIAIASLTGTDYYSGNKVEIIKSTNSGESFAPLSIVPINFSQGFYDFVFGIAPNNVNTYYTGACSFYKSIDGGLTFSDIGGYSGSFGTHVDMEDLVLFGNNVVLSTDGGVSESTDGFTNLANWKSTCKGLDALEYWGFDVGFNTDQMGGGKYHNGNNMFNPEWNNGKALPFGGGEEADGKAIFSRPNSMYF